MPHNSQPVRDTNPRARSPRRSASGAEICIWSSMPWLARTTSIRSMADASAIERIEVVRANHGIELQMQISAPDAERLGERARGLVSRTGCGLCGIETIGDALRVPREVSHGLGVKRSALWRASAELSRRQSVNNATSAVHGAGWATADGELVVAREDVGRHNALDKVLGSLAR